MSLEDLLEGYRSQLKEVTQEQHSPVLECNLVIKLSRKLLSSFRNQISTSCFIHDSEEIHFFKNVKSVPLCKLIYYSEIKSLETRYPKVGLEQQKKFLKRKMKMLNKFFLEHIEFVNYVQNNHSHFDFIYFVRKNFQESNVSIIKQYYQEPEFSTSHDFLFAKVKAFTKLAGYVENRLSFLLNPKNPPKNFHRKSNLMWTSSKTSLTELIYALHSSGAINSGAIDIKEIAQLAEDFFNVDLGDYYRTFLDLKRRKTSRTKFMKELANSLEKRMNETDE